MLNVCARRKCVSLLFGICLHSLWLLFQNICHWWSLFYCAVNAVELFTTAVKNVGMGMLLLGRILTPTVISSGVKRPWHIAWIVILDLFHSVLLRVSKLFIHAFRISSVGNRSSSLKNIMHCWTSETAEIINNYGHEIENCVVSTRISVTLAHFRLCLSVDVCV